MPGGDHCAVWVCYQDRKYPEKQKILPDVEIFYSSRNKKKRFRRCLARAINVDQLKVSVGAKVCSNHFVQGYRTSECPTDQLCT